RCETTIEPLLSKQWFVKTKPLAERALKSLEAGEIRFIPERWTKDYLRWMTDIQDWCISRQLWWGHPIPAWHCQSCHHVNVCIETPTQCAACQSSELIQDPDVLDTWFSSGLWPFSTMGWPDLEAQDLKDFYPTNVLVTGFDIIFFWVSKMIMFGLELTDVSPFHTVYIHGLIRDEKGQKMSKSKGNTVDPVDVINEIGCDGFRFALTSLITYGGQDIKLAKDKIELGKLFANKLWNASRFVMMNLEGVDGLPIDTSKLSKMDTWVLSRYNTAVSEVTTSLEEYKFGETASILYEFVWNGFCDWYVEYAKKQLKDPALTMNTQRILLHVLEGILKLLHPIMPYITEEIWLKLPHRKGATIMLAAFPQANLALIDETTNKGVDFILSTVRAVRNIRQQYTVGHPVGVNVLIESPDALERQAMAEGQEILCHFVKIETLTLAETLKDTPKQVAVNMVGQSRILVDLEGIIDLDQEQDRLKKKIEVLRKEQETLYRMMGNEDFLEKAPQAVIEKNKSRLTEVNKQIKTLEEQIAELVG
ncbi:MAG: class I tRNA ligase family protein, partial [Cyanobacteria bacterium]|nr:class I tRNA ligase family protein [Cyanobacteriota bacterium]